MIKKVYYRTLIDLIYGLKEIVLFNKENFFAEKFKKNYKHNLDIALKVRIIELIPRPLIEIIFITVIVVIVYFFFKIQRFQCFFTIFRSLCIFSIENIAKYYKNYFFE